MNKRVVWRVFDATAILFASGMLLFWAVEVFLVNPGFHWSSVAFSAVLIPVGLMATYRGWKMGIRAVFGHQIPKRPRRKRRKRPGA